MEELLIFLLKRYVTNIIIIVTIAIKIKEKDIDAVRLVFDINFVIKGPADVPRFTEINRNVTIIHLPLS